MSLVAYANSDSESDDEESKPNVNVSKSSISSSQQQTLIKEVLPSASNLDLISNVIKEKSNKSIKISVPSLSSFDEDEDEPTKKKLKTSNTRKSGLFALLPAPKNSGLITSQKSLIPQSVMKNSTSQANTSKSKTIHTSDDEAEYDDDDEPLRFFTVKDTSQVGTQHPKSSAQVFQPTSSCHEMRQNETKLDEEQLSALEQEAIQIQMEDDDQDRQFPFDEEIDDYPQGPVEVDDQMLQRLQGRRDRGKEEINFIDVSVAAEMPQGNELKRLTEETNNEQNKPKGNPTPQQRRKHQITYLAFQAKERELELKNQWAQNRLTRRQTQSKYGF